MQPSPLAPPPQVPAHRQLPLPLDELPMHPHPPRPLIAIPVRQVWASLTPQVQAQVRQRLIRIVQEVVRDEQH